MIRRQHPAGKMGEKIFFTLCLLLDVPHSLAKLIKLKYLSTLTLALQSFSALNERENIGAAWLVLCLARWPLAAPGFKEPDASGSDTGQHARSPSSDSFNSSSRENYYHRSSPNSLPGTVRTGCVESSWRKWWEVGEVRMAGGRVGPFQQPWGEAALWSLPWAGFTLALAKADVYLSYWKSGRGGPDPGATFFPGVATAGWVQVNHLLDSQPSSLPHFYTLQAGVWALLLVSQAFQMASQPFARRLCLDGWEEACPLPAAKHLEWVLVSHAVAWKIVRLLPCEQPFLYLRGTTYKQILRAFMLIKLCFCCC